MFSDYGAPTTSKLSARLESNPNLQLKTSSCELECFVTKSHASGTEQHML